MAAKISWFAYIFSILVLSLLRLTASQSGQQYATIPINLQGVWFSYEEGLNTFTTMDERQWQKKTVHGSSGNRGDAQQLSITKGECVAADIDLSGQEVRLIIRESPSGCLRCNELHLRGMNVIEYRFTSCTSVSASQTVNVKEVCKDLPVIPSGLQPDFITMFADSPTPLSCRPSLEGVWQFAYVRRDQSEYGVCNDPFSNITACQKPGTRFTIENQRFDMFYQACENNRYTKTMHITYRCLDDWYIGKNHYFVTETMGENRPEEKYRCFLENKNDDLTLGKSIYASCSSLKTPYDSPERIQLTRVKSQTVIPRCHFPLNFSGNWVNPTNVESTIIINDTHIEEIYKPDQARERSTFYICMEMRDTRYLLARLGIDGCQVDYQCWDILPRRHNIIRYRVGQIFSNITFREVCSWASFLMENNWMYNIYIAKDPDEIDCPIQGKFKFVQRGDNPFKTRYRGGVTVSPRDYVNCTEKEADFAICNDKRYTTKYMQIDVERCVTLDHRARPIGEYDEPDNVFKCIGFWRENVKSYLITYEQEDGYSKYSCWVYERLEFYRIVISKSTNTYCQSFQKASSFSSKEGSSIMLELLLNERLYDNCPMLYDDGKNSYESNSIQYLSKSYSNKAVLIILFLSFTILQFL